VSERRNRLLLVDGHAYAYRAFFAIRQLRSPTGQPTNAVFGFIKMLLRLEGAVQPTHAAVIWDGGLDSGRVESLPGYKAQRPPMPDDLEAQLDEIQEWLDAAGRVSLCHEGVEADDWIATAARSAVRAGFQVIIASPDKDFMQLVTDDVGIINPGDKSERVWTAQDVEARSGVKPEQIVDWLALVGDSVDNIPGVAGVGPKTAANLLRQFGSVERLFGQLDQVASGRIRQALATAEPDVRRNCELIRLKDGLDCEGEVGNWTLGAGEDARLGALYERWGFRTLLQELNERVAARQQGSLL
jgi:DNA polymerase I